MSGVFAFQGSRYLQASHVKQLQVGLSLLAAVGVANVAHADDNLMKVVVANGPFSGTYKPPVDSTFCSRMKSPDLARSD